METLYLDTKYRLTSRRIKKIAKRAYKKFEKTKCGIVLSNNLLKNEELIDALLEYKLTIFDGRWLFKLLLVDALEYLANLEKRDIKTLSVAILADNIDEIILAQIIEIAMIVKKLRIVTSNVNKFSYIEEKLYQEFGIAVQITNNKEKAILNLDIIFNIDFFEEKIKRYKISKNAIIVNVLCKIRNIFENFNGIIINDYELSYNKAVLEEINKRKAFDKNVLYEALIYKKDRYSNLKKRLISDEIKLIKLS